MHDFENLTEIRVWIVDQQDRRIADLAEIVRRDAGRHADRDAVRAVDQQVRKLRRQNDRLHVALIVGRNEINRVAIEIVQHVGGWSSQTCFGVTHGGGRHPGQRAEVPLLVDQRLPHVPVLSHADQRRIDRAFTMRVIVTARVAADLGRI